MFPIMGLQQTDEPNQVTLNKARCGVPLIKIPLLSIDRKCKTPRCNPFKYAMLTLKTKTLLNTYNNVGNETNGRTLRTRPAHPTRPASDDKKSESFTKTRSLISKQMFGHLRQSISS
uniref:Uncharacterized protein n=1 Tax=Glossina pallidipes TaxID=7398 RepID=A0A1A9Z968_GLOPL